VGLHMQPKQGIASALPIHKNAPTSPTTPLLESVDLVGLGWSKLLDDQQVANPTFILSSVYAPSSALRRSSPCAFHHWCRIVISVPMQKWRTPMSRKYFA
jgi:hypothetical protein